MEIHLKIKDVVGQDEKGRHIFLVNNEDWRDCILERKDWVLQEIVKEHLLKQPKAIAMILDDNDIRNTIYMQEKAKRECIDIEFLWAKVIAATFTMNFAIAFAQVSWGMTQIKNTNVTKRFKL